MNCTKDIAGLLTDIEAVIKKHVILSDQAAAALAVWVLHTWTFELRDIVAYVAIEAPEDWRTPRRKRDPDFSAN